jgi:hypothetical protein
MVKLKQLLGQFYVARLLVSCYDISVSQMTTNMFRCRSHNRFFCPLSWFSHLSSNFEIRVTRPASLVEQNLLTLPQHLSSPPDFCGACVAQSLVLWIIDCLLCEWVCVWFFFVFFCFLGSGSLFIWKRGGGALHCLSFDVWLPLCYLHTFLGIVLWRSHLIKKFCILCFCVLSSGW